MTYYDYLCRLLEPMRVYRTERGTLSGGELYAAGAVLDEADGAMEYAEQEGVLQTAEGEGLARREKLFSRCPVSVSTALRREAIAALARINADSFTLDAINSTLSGCGIKALAEETEKKGTVKVWFPNTVGVPDEFSQVESIILDIILPSAGGVLLPVSDMARVRGTEIYMAERGGRAPHMGEL